MIVMLILSIVLAASMPVITKRVVADEKKEQINEIPAGVINSYAGLIIPEGWLLCNGQAVSRIGSYANLFNAIGTTFGTGNGSTTFNLPDLRGEFIRGWDNGRNVDSGRPFASVQSSTNLIHTHGLYSSNGYRQTSNGYGYGIGNTEWGAGVAGGAPGGTWKFWYYDASGNQLVSGEGGSESRPRNIALNYIIKY